MARKAQPKDLDHIAEYIVEEVARRKKDRKHLDHMIKEIDRQVSMKPNLDHKMKIGSTGLPTTVRDPSKAWLPEIELPLQAEALETLVSDVRSMEFPDSGTWFKANSALTDKYLDRVDFTSIIAGDENEVPTKINQDNADKIVSGLLNHYHRQYDFRGNVDVINAESLSYGAGVGRARMVTKEVISETAKGIVKKDKRIPVLIPKSLKMTLLDDREHIILQEGFSVGPLTIFEMKMSYDDLKDAARKGGRDPNSDNGGWIPGNIRNLEPDKHNDIELFEGEGDFIIPRKSTGSILLPGTIVTVAKGKNAHKVVRLRFKKIFPNSVIVFPYHREKVGSPYTTSPLMKGWPLQAAATEALMNVFISAALKNGPPISYDRNDMLFIQNGGPVVEPFAQWATLGEIKVYDNFGDPAAMLQIYLALLQQYADAVGMPRARLGAQTVSHTTKFAKQAELQRGAVRTVDYVGSSLQGPLPQWLSLEYEMAVKEFKGTETYPLNVGSYRGYVEIEKKHLPDLVTFEAFGSGMPAEESQKRQDKLAAVQFAMQVDRALLEEGGKPVLNKAEIIEEILMEGGWTDIDPFINQEEIGAETPQTEEEIQV